VYKQSNFEVSLVISGMTALIASVLNQVCGWCVCVCSLRYPTCIAHAPCCHLWPVDLCATFPHCLLNGTIVKIMECDVHIAECGHSFSGLSYDRSKASSKASSPHSAIQSSLFQMRVSSFF
jgi:hypothetical protein